MTERRITLIDVENGMFDLSLHTILTPPCFTFFWGIIQTCNRFKPRFKNPFTLTVSQAFAAGGGSSRQAVWTKQQQLNKVRIEGRWLIKITPGSKSRYVPATYNINYKLLIPQDVMIPEFNANESKIIDTPIDTGVDTGVDTVATILRSDQRRGEKIPPTPLNDVSTGKEGTRETEAGGGLDSPEEEEELRMIQKAKRIQDLILRKWRMQIPKAPDIGDCKKALREFGWDHKLLEEAITQAPMTLTHPEPSSALSLVCVGARRIQSEGNGPVTPALLAEREREIDGLKADLKQARKNPDDNAAFISQHEHILELKESALERLKTE